MDKRRIIRSAGTGAWLTTMPSLLNGSDLSAEEFRDGIRLRFGLTPTALPHRCDGCGDRFTTEHAMSCRKGGLILQRHNDLAAEWGQLCGQAFTPSTVSDEPLIQSSRDVQVAGSNRTEPTPELRGDIAVHGFWTRGTTAIFDICVTDTDAPSNRHTAPQSVLRRHERKKKQRQIRRPLHRQTPHLHPSSVLGGRASGGGGHRCFTAIGLQPCSQMEAFVLRSVWLRSLPPFGRIGSLCEQMPPG